MAWKPKPYSEWTAEQKAKHRDSFRLRYQTDLEFREKVKARTKRYHSKNREKYLARYRAQRDGEPVIPKIGDGNRKIGTTIRDPVVIKSYRRKPSALRSTLLRSAKRRAQERGLDFNLTLDDIIIPDKCPVFGITLEKKDDGRQSCSPSLDRINNELGYVRGNVMVISWAANSLKSNASLDQLKRLVSYVSTNSVTLSNECLDIFEV